MAFYWMQMLATYMIKGGYAKDSVELRRKQHETAGGPVRLLGVIPSADRRAEADIFRFLNKHRLKDPKDDRCDFEVFPPDPAVIHFIRGKVLSELGYQPLAKVIDPRQQTCREWLELVRDVRKGDAHDAATWALKEDARLRKNTRPFVDRVGGWDLNEAIGGNGFLDRQTVMNFASEIIDGKRWLIHRLTHQGDAYRYPVFAEWYVRENRCAAPDTAVYGGIAIGKAKQELPKKTRRLREERREERKRIAADPKQLKIPGAA